MSSQSRLWVTAGLTASSVALIVGLSSLSGCNPHKDQLRPEGLFSRIGRQTGQLIEPKRCVLRVAILNRPFKDAAINETVWKVADEQAITPEARRALEVNGLRIGQITGELPAELQAILDAPPPHKVTGKVPKAAATKRTRNFFIDANAGPRNLGVPSRNSGPTSSFPYACLSNTDHLRPIFIPRHTNFWKTISSASPWTSCG